MTYFIYRYIIQFFAFVARYAGSLNEKLKTRNTGLDHQRIPQLKDSIWVHCASLGEFEQGKVLIDALRIRYPERELVLTFFSSSGYEKRKNYDKVDYVLYLPYDTSGAMSSFVNHLQPSMVVFVKYEFWFTLLDVLATRNIPFVFVSASFRSSQYLFKSIFSSLLERILKAEHIFVQHLESQNLLYRNNYRSVTVAGDTRIDRVLEVRNQNFDWPALEKWIGQATAVIGGSTWPKDEALFSEVIPKFDQWKWVLAPHEITEEHLTKMKNWLGNQAVFLSEIGMDRPISNHYSVLVIDRIGLLSLLYRYGSIAYIGGGHGAGIHNTLEPAVYGLPLIFGPKFSKFQEAVDFVANSTAMVIRNGAQLEAALHRYSDTLLQEDIEKWQRAYFERNSGAVSQIMRTIEKIILQV